MAMLEGNWPEKPSSFVKANFAYVFTGFRNQIQEPSEGLTARPKKKLLLVNGLDPPHPRGEQTVATICVSKGELDVISGEEVNLNSLNKKDTDTDMDIDLDSENLISKGYACSVKLLPGEEHGWWSNKKPDGRLRARAVIDGKVNGNNAKILLDSGANLSILSERLAKKWIPKEDIRISDETMRIQGVSETKLWANKKAEIKINLSWNIVYVFDVWVGPQNGGCDIILGTDFLISAGICLDLHRGRIKLPDEVIIPLSGQKHALEEYLVERKIERLSENAIIDPGCFIIRKFRVPNINNSIIWLTDIRGVLPTLIHQGKKFIRLQLTNVSDKTIHLTTLDEIICWVTNGSLPWKTGYVRTSGNRYKEWQVLVYEATSTPEFNSRDAESYTKWLSEQSPIVAKQDYPTPVKILQRDEPLLESVEILEELVDLDMEDALQVDSLDTDWYIAAGVGEVIDKLNIECEVNTFSHHGQELIAEDYAAELAMLPELTDFQTPPIDVDALDIGEDGNTPEEISRMRDIVRDNISVFIDSGNAVPPPAKGVYCDIDVQGAEPIAQKARRVKPEYLEKLHELIKSLLQSGLIKFSTSQWASPIVIVPKKNKKDIRLCIDYREVNAKTALILSAMPMIDDLLLDFDHVQWLCSFDGCSGFWGVQMTKRASEISAFICPLGHFQWLRMPQGLKNAPQIYQRMLDNALWGFVKPAGGWDTPVEGTNDKGVEADIFDKGISEDLHLHPVICRRSYIDDISFYAKDWNECCEILERFLKRMKECGISLSLSKSWFGKKRIEFLSHWVNFNGLEAKPKDLESIKGLKFPTNLKGVQSFLGTLNYYNKFLQDFSGAASVLYELTPPDFNNPERLERPKLAFEKLKKQMCEVPILKHFDREKEPIIILFANGWAIGSILAQETEGIIYPIRFISRVLKDAELRYHPAEQEVLALLKTLNNYYHILAGKKIKVYTRHSVMKWIFTSKSLFGRQLKFAVMLSPWDLEIIKAEKGECSLAGLLATSIIPPDLQEESLSEVYPEKMKKKIAHVENFLNIPIDYNGFVLTFDGSAKPPKSGAYGSCAYVLWKVPDWSVVYAEGIYLPEATVNEAEYKGIINGLKKVIEMKIDELVVVGDSRIAIQQITGAIQCHKSNLSILLSEVNDIKPKFKYIKFMHVVREYNGSADYLAGDTISTATSKVYSTSVSMDNQTEVEGIFKHLEKLNKLPEVIYPPDKNPVDSVSISSVDNITDQDPKPLSCTVDVGQHPKPLSEINEGVIAAINGEELDAEREDVEVIKAQEERLRRIAKSQDEEKRWKLMKWFLNRELDKLSELEAKLCSKEAELYEIDSYGVLYYVGYRSQRDISIELQMDIKRRPSRWRIVIPTTLQVDIMRASHSESPGGHQGVVRTFQRLKEDYFWPKMYQDAEQFVKSCIDCSTGKGKPRLKGWSPGNIVAERPFQVVSMDFALPFPKSKEGNTVLLLFMCTFSGYMACKPLKTASALESAKAFEECIFRRFGACEILRHDRDPKFMAEFFKEFNKAIGQRQKATLSYRPQANGQQERAVQTVVRTIRLYVEEENQTDWDEWAERLMFVLNTSYDFTRKDTPFYLIHGWDAKRPLQAMVPPPDSQGRLDGNASLWRKNLKKDYDRVQNLALKIQKKLKQDRAKAHNDSLKLNQEGQEDNIGPGDSVWLYINNVKPGFSKKLAHKWHGPFRVSERISEYSVKLELPDKDGYRFYPVVHTSRLKLRHILPERPKIELTVDEHDRFDFDESLLPEDSWVNIETGDFEVEKIINIRYRSSKRRTGRRRKEYEVKWLGYEETTWEPEENLNCPSLLYEFEQKLRAEERFKAMQISDEPNEQS